MNARPAGKGRCQMMEVSMRKRILYGLLFLIVAALAVRVVLLVTKRSEGSGGGFGGAGGRPPVAVEIDSVRTGPIQEVRQFTGTIHPRNRYILSPKLSGRLVGIPKNIGDPVRRGEVLAELDDAEYQQAVREAEANLMIAQASLAEAESQLVLATQELERVQKLKDKGYASASEYDAATTAHEAQQSRLKLARAQVDQREAALSSARIRLDYTRLTASEPGLIGERFVDEGALLAPNAPVLSVVAIDQVFVRTTIVERDYGRVHVGQQAAVDVDAFPGRGFIGRVARIAPLLEETSRMAQMEVEVANESLELKPGMFARVNVVLAERDRAILVPSRAVVDRAGIPAVFLLDVEKKTVRQVPVEVGIVTADQTEILSPAIDGLVITLGQHLLADGSPVILPPAGGATGAGPGGGQGGGPAARPEGIPR